jgi:outer membrane protein
MKLLHAMVLAGSILWTARGFAEAPQAHQHRIGLINMQEIILSVPDGKAAREALEKEIKEKESYFQKKKQELDKLQEDFNKQQSLLSEEAKIEKQKEFQNKFMALRSEEMEFQRHIKEKEVEETQRIATKAAKIVDKLAQDNNLDEVREANQAGLVYIKNPRDLTKEVIAVYNSQNDSKKDGTKAKAASSNLSKN